MSKVRSKSRFGHFLVEDSGWMMVGVLAAMVWANVNAYYGSKAYSNFVSFELERMFTDGHGEHGDHSAVVHGEVEEHADHGEHAMTVQHFVSGFLMAFFFAIAAKEVFESLLPGGDLNDPRKAAVPILATVGGVVGPAVLYYGLATCLGVLDLYGRGWAIPTATDIAFSYLVARIIFGRKHPAIAFLLLLAILDDAIGLMIIALFYTSGDVHFEWLLLSVGAALVAYAFNRGCHGLRLHNHLCYLPFMFISWYGFYRAGVEPALGFIPVIFAMPHAKTDLGLFVEEEDDLHDTLNEFEHFWEPYVELFLGLFALVNAGVVLSSVGYGTMLVLIGLIVGKTVFITLLVWLAEKCGFELPEGMTYNHVVTLGLVASIGFAVALFVSTRAFQAGPLQDEVKMGALLSVFAGLLAYGYARFSGIRCEVEAE